jgi:hypothetical protein
MRDSNPSSSHWKCIMLPLDTNDAENGAICEIRTHEDFSIVYKTIPVVRLGKMA